MIFLAKAPVLNKCSLIYSDALNSFNKILSFVPFSASVKIRDYRYPFLVDINSLIV